MIRRLVALVSVPIIIFGLLGTWGLINSTNSGRRLALIVNTWNDFPSENTTDVDAMPAQALQAYFALRSIGFSDEDVYLMLYHPNQSLIDVDGDGSNDLEQATIDNDVVDMANLGAALENLASNLTQYDEAIVYVVGHGYNMSESSSAFSFENGDLVTETEFDRWLDLIECKHLTILLDFCYSGDFAGSLKDTGRLIVSAAEDGKESWYYWDWARLLNTTNKAVYGNSGSAFFHPFWKKFGEGTTIEDAYDYGKGECVRWGSIDTRNARAKNVTQIQNPQIYSIYRTDLEKFVFFFPGGSSVYYVALLILSFYELVIIAAAVVTWIQRPRH